MLRDRRGYTLAEALVAMLVAGVLTLCLAVVLGVVGRAARRHAEAAAAAETERTVPAILGRELRALTASDATFHADSVRLRAFRGRGIVCAHAPGWVDVAYDGVRLPEEDKDSVVLISTAGEVVRDIVTVAAGNGCAGLSLRLSIGAHDGPHPPLIALVFETGAYSIAASAFRYRRGNAGRQPITEENIATSASGIDAVDDRDGSATALVSLRSSEARRAPTMRWRLGMLQGATRSGESP